MGAGDGKTKAKPSGQKQTNTTLGSVAVVKHNPPQIELWGRIAATAVLGTVNGKKITIEPGRINNKTPSLHFTIIISDDYYGIIGIDGQPTGAERGLEKAMFLRTNFYHDTFPGEIIIKIKLSPPKGMSEDAFAQKLVKTAKNFKDYSVKYSLPENVSGGKMLEGEYNSSSYISGLLKSVMGYIPQIQTPGYQTPGWENPVPSSYFRDWVMG